MRCAIIPSPSIPLFTEMLVLSIFVSVYSGTLVNRIYIYTHRINTVTSVWYKSNIASTITITGIHSFIKYIYTIHVFI